MLIHSQIVSRQDLAKDRLSSNPRNSRSNLWLGFDFLSRSGVNKPIGLDDRDCDRLWTDLGKLHHSKHPCFKSYKLPNPECVQFRPPTDHYSNF